MKNPRVSVGLPVYNGEKYIAQAIESVLDQTYGDFELVISDNASNDKTQAICEEYSLKDSRIRYYRQDVNQGATWNFNRAFELSTGEYFNWLAHDDLLAPDFLEKSVAVLDKDPETVLCFSKVVLVDENSAEIEKFDIELRTDSNRPSQRFYDILIVWHNCYAIFGLIRREALLKTPLMGPYVSGDIVLLARLGLMGKFHKFLEPLFYSRIHALQSNRLYNVWVDHYAYDKWFMSGRNNKFYLPKWAVLRDYVSMVSQADIRYTERVLSLRAILRWIVRYRKLLLKDVSIALRQLLRVSNPVSETNSAAQNRL